MRLAPALALSMLMAAPAFAADFPVLRGSYAPAPVRTPAPDDDQTQWNGWYAGAFAGYASGKYGTMTTTPNALTPNFYNGVSIASVPAQYRQNQIFNISLGSNTKTSYGVFAGYNQAWGDVVLGVEADVTSLRMSKASQQTFINSDRNGIGVGYSALTGTQQTKLDAYATFRARAGWAYGNVMPFATLGLAVAKGSYSNTLTLAYSATAFGPPAQDFSMTASNGKKDVYVLGGALGAGVEYLITPNILLRGEYQFVRFRNSNLPLDISTVRGAVAVKF